MGIALLIFSPQHQRVFFICTGVSREAAGVLMTGSDQGIEISFSNHRYRYHVPKFEAWGFCYKIIEDSLNSTVPAHMFLLLSPRKISTKM